MNLIWFYKKEKKLFIPFFFYFNFCYYSFLLIFDLYLISPVWHNFIYLFIYSFIHLSIHLFIILLFYLFIYLFFNTLIILSFIFLFPYQLTYLSVYLFVNLFIYLFICFPFSFAFQRFEAGESSTKFPRRWCKC